MRFVARFAICALSLWVAQRFVPGIRIDDVETVLIAALILGFVNAVIRPVLVFLTFPITIVTLGLFLLVLNAAMLALVASLVTGFQIAGFGSAILGSIVISITSWFASHFIGGKGEKVRSD